MSHVLFSWFTFHNKARPWRQVWNVSLISSSILITSRAELCATLMEVSNTHISKHIRLFIIMMKRSKICHMIRDTDRYELCRDEWAVWYRLITINFVTPMLKRSVFPWYLPYCVLVTPYCQHWLRPWLGSQRHHAIARTTVEWRLFPSIPV